MNCLLLSISTVNVDWLIAGFAHVFGLNDLFVCNDRMTGFVPVNVIVRLLIAFVLEHFIFVISYGVDRVIEVVPKWVRAEVSSNILAAKRTLRQNRGRDRENEYPFTPMRSIQSGAFAEQTAKTFVACFN